MPRLAPPPDSFLCAFGKVLRQARLARGLTQADLALLIGMKRLSITQYESGLRLPPLDVIVRIARACDEVPSRLLSRLDDVPLPELGLLEDEEDAA